LALFKHGVYPKFAIEKTSWTVDRNWRISIFRQAHLDVHTTSKWFTSMITLW
jgi:hypothetical protein